MKEIISKLKDIGYGTLGIIFIAGLTLLMFIIIRGGLLIGAVILPFLVKLTTVLTLVSLFIFIPLALFKKTRGWGGGALILSSYLFGLTLWVYSALTAYIFWGLFGLLIGIFLLGIGVVPVAFLASLLNGAWMPLLEMVYMLFLTFGARILGFYIVEKIESSKAYYEENY